MTSGANVADRKEGWSEPRPEEVRELLEQVARSLRPVYLLTTDDGFDKLLRSLDELGL